MGNNVKDAVTSHKNTFVHTTKWEKLIDLVWPVQRSEIKKFLPLSIMMMFIIFIYHVLRGAKDAALIPVLGAEMISTVKLWGVLPSAVLFILIYTKLSNIFARERLFYIIVIYFLMFFVLYAFVIYPTQDLLHLDLSLLKSYSPFLKLPIVMIENWTITLFFIHAELWGSIILSLLFWQFVNHITPLDQAKRFYSMLSFLGQLGMLFAGQVNQYVAEFNRNKDLDSAVIWGKTLVALVVVILLSGIALATIYWWMNRYVLTDIKHYNPQLMSNKPKKNKSKLSLLKSLKYILSSFYLRMIAALVICYGIGMNLVEAVWKNQLSIQFPEEVDYLDFMGKFQSWSAVITMMATVVGLNLIRRVSWYAGAIVTPLMIAITGSLFFVFILFKEQLSPTLAIISTTPLIMSVVIGAVQNTLSKSIKYTAFDATKEMAYIPLDEELKTKGKAAVDVVGARLGKSVGAAIQQMLFFVTGLTIPLLTYEIFVIFAITMVIWFLSVTRLNAEIKKCNVT